jgi:hypothetical protein
MTYVMAGRQYPDLTGAWAWDVDLYAGTSEAMRAKAGATASHRIRGEVKTLPTLYWIL